MKIIIPVKQVPETSNVKMDEKTGTMVRDGVESILNPLDLYAVEAGIRLKEQFGGEVTVISMGPPKAVEVIKEALSMGCDKGVLLSAKEFAGSDTFATSYVLAQAIKKLSSFDLILCGERATDGDTGQVGPGIASLLDLPLSTFTSEITEIAEEKIQVKRLIEGGYELIELKLPAVLTVVKEVSDPRLPTLSGKLKSKTIDIPVWGPKDMDLDAELLGLKGSPTRVVNIFTPKVLRQPVKYFIKDDESLNLAVDEMIKYLSDCQVI